MSLIRGSGSSAGERLRLKIGLVLPVLVDAGDRLIAHPRVRDLYPEYLFTSHCVIRASVPLMQAGVAEATTRADSDPVAAAVAPYLEPDQLKLYRLIWNRFVASQMNPAVSEVTTVEIEARREGSPDVALLRANGSVLKDPGFLRLYGQVSETEAQNAPEEEGDDESKVRLPEIAEGDVLALREANVGDHATQPPPRFNEASLVKFMEENGIGRPSTYASIIGTIEAREYMEKREGKLYPTELGFLVTDLLVEHFKDIMNVEYTAALEAELDEIEEGKDNLLNTLSQFWKKFEKDLKAAQKEMKDVKRMEEQTDEVCDKCGKPMVIKWGKNGQFIACQKYPECKNTKEFTNLVPGSYVLHVTSPGFKPHRQTGIEVRLGSDVRMDVRLGLGPKSETTEVFGSSALTYDSGSREDEIAPEALEALPLLLSGNVRSSAALAMLMPGVTTGGRGDAFDRAVHEIAHATQHLLDELVTTAAPKNREVEAEKRRARSRARYAS